MSESFLRIAAVKARTDLSRTGIYARMARGEFPRSIALGPRAVAWLASDIDRWIAQQIQASRTAARLHAATDATPTIARRSNL